MSLKTPLIVCVWLVIFVQAFFNPILLGNDRSRLKRFPVITVALIVINVVVFVVSQNVVGDQDRALENTRLSVFNLVESDPAILRFEYVQKRLKDTDLVTDGKVLAVEHALVVPPTDDRAVTEELGKLKAAELLSVFTSCIDNYEAALNSHFIYRFALAGNGKWKPSQLLTAMFLHGDVMHIAGNMIFLAALSVSLESLWGSALFAAFYILVGLAASIPGLIVPFDGPMLGASGAVSGLMGAFLVSLHKNKLKVGWLALPMFWILLIFEKKFWGIVRIPAYVLLPYYFASQMLLWWFFKEQGLISNVAYSVHIGGFFFGMLFAVGLESLNLKLNFFHMKFSESLAGAETKELLSDRQYAAAEQKLEKFLQKNPDDTQAVLAMIEVNRRTVNYARLNELYSLLIRGELSKGDKDAALSYYDQLLGEFPEDNMQPSIDAADWMTVCDHIYNLGMIREAAVEYERLAGAATRKPIAFKACVLGGEAALKVKEISRARRLFTKALELNPPAAQMQQVMSGMDRCESAEAESCAKV